MGSAAPEGWVTMLFTDIEGSTRLAARLGDGWAAVLAAHDEIVRAAIEAHRGFVDGTAGDSFFAIFDEPGQAISAARDAQRGLRAHAWPPEVGRLWVRMGIHAGSVQRKGGGHVGLEVHRAARVEAAAHGGQILLTAEARSAVADPAQVVDLGRHRLKDFPEPIRLFALAPDPGAVGDADTDRALATPRSLDVRATNLPPTATDLVGRDHEVVTVVDALRARTGALVTIAGGGGAGKTTLALAAARRLLDDFAGGAWWVPAESVTAADELLRAIAATLRVEELPGRDLAGDVAEHVGSSHTLVLLDNLEQVAEAAATVAELQRRSSGLAVLATSRTPLRLRHERVVTLGPLSPEAAAELLLSRAAQVGAVGIDPEDRSTIPALCDRVGRLPLALELIAPKLRVLSPQETLDRLGNWTDEEADGADRPARHRSMRATLEWSLGLLDADARRLFAELAVFRGPAPLELLAAVSGVADVTRSLGPLIDHAMVQRTPAGFALTAAARPTATEHLAASGRQPQLLSALATALAALGGRFTSPAVAPADRAMALALDADIRASVVRTRAADPALHAALVAAFHLIWVHSGRIRFALEELDAAIAGDPASANGPGEGAAGGVGRPAGAELHRARAYVRALIGSSGDALADTDEALALVGQDAPAMRARTLLVRSQVLAKFDRDGAHAAALEALELVRPLGDHVLTTRCLLEVIETALMLGHHEVSARALREADEVVGTTGGDPRRMVEMARGEFALATGDDRGALLAHLSLLDEDFDYVAWSVAACAAACSGLGHHVEAVELGVIARSLGRDLAVAPEALVQVGPTLAQVEERAHAAIPRPEADAARARAVGVDAGQRVRRARQLCLSIIDGG